MLYVPGARAACAVHGDQRQAMNPLTGADSSGPAAALDRPDRARHRQSRPTASFPAGDGIAKDNYIWPGLALAPRFGVAYDLTGTQKLVLRGGGGLFYDRPDGDSVFAPGHQPAVLDVHDGPQRPRCRISRRGLRDVRRAGAARSSSTTPSCRRRSSGTPACRFTLPWASALDVEYVGNHGYNLLSGTTDINAPDFGAAYLPQNQNPTLAASAAPGANALPTELLPAFRGYGAINRQHDRRLQQLPLHPDLVQPAIP